MEDAKVVTPHSQMSLEELFSKVKKDHITTLPLVIKTDVSGTGEAIKDLLGKLSYEEVEVQVIHQAVGGISESDILLASAAKTPAMSSIALNGTNNWPWRRKKQKRKWPVIVLQAWLVNHQTR